MSVSSPAQLAELTIRRSTAGDEAALARLAALDSARAPAGDCLVAEEAGTLRAALPLDGGPPLADPFKPSAALVAMLELRAGALAAPAGAPPGARGLPVWRALRRSLPERAEAGLGLPRGAHT